MDHVRERLGRTRRRRHVEGPDLDRLVRDRLAARGPGVQVVPAPCRGGSVRRPIGAAEADRPPQGGRRDRQQPHVRGDEPAQLGPSAPPQQALHPGRHRQAVGVRKARRPDPAPLRRQLRVAREAGQAPSGGARAADGEQQVRVRVPRSGRAGHPAQPRFDEQPDGPGHLAHQSGVLVARGQRGGVHGQGHGAPDAHVLQPDREPDPRRDREGHDGNLPREDRPRSGPAHRMVQGPVPPRPDGAARRPGPGAHLRGDHVLQRGARQDRTHRVRGPARGRAR